MPSDDKSKGDTRTAREKLACYGFQDETQEVIERGELGVILLGEECTIHLLADDAIAEAGMSEYQGQKVGSFFLRQSGAHAVIAKLRNAALPS
jgi:hypothetical protein